MSNHVIETLRNGMRWIEAARMQADAYEQCAQDWIERVPTEDGHPVTPDELEYLEEMGATFGRAKPLTVRDNIRFSAQRHFFLDALKAVIDRISPAMFKEVAAAAANNNITFATPPGKAGALVALRNGSVHADNMWGSTLNGLTKLYPATLGRKDSVSARDVLLSGDIPLPDVRAWLDEVEEQFGRILDALGGSRIQLDQPMFPSGDPH